MNTTTNQTANNTTKSVFTVTEVMFKNKLDKIGLIERNGQKLSAKVTSVQDFTNKALNIPSKIIKLELTTRFKAEEALKEFKAGNLTKAYNLISTGYEMLSKRDGSFPAIPAVNETVDVLIGEVFSKNNNQNILVVTGIVVKAAETAKSVKSIFASILDVKENELDNNSEFDEEKDLIEQKAKIKTSALPFK